MPYFEEGAHSVYERKRKRYMLKIFKRAKRAISMSLKII